MEVWNKYVGKKVFLRTKHDRVYSGKIISIDEDDNIFYISLIDIKGNNITLIHSDIVEIKEEQ